MKQGGTGYGKAINAGREMIGNIWSLRLGRDEKPPCLNI
jgi:hypothetical protein